MKIVEKLNIEIFNFILGFLAIRLLARNCFPEVNKLRSTQDIFLQNSILLLSDVYYLEQRKRRNIYASLK